LHFVEQKGVCISLEKSDFVEELVFHFAEQKGFCILVKRNDFVEELGLHFVEQEVCFCI
jgi:hypothetical protein